MDPEKHLRLHLKQRGPREWLLFSHSVRSDSPWPHGLQRASLPCPPLPPRVFKPMSIESEVPSDYLTLCRPLLLLPSVFPSIRVFSNKSALHIRWPKCYNFSFSISPSNEYSGFISFRKDWLDLLAVQWTFTSLLQHHSSKASILPCLAFFMICRYLYKIFRLIRKIYLLLRPKYILFSIGMNLRFLLM